jgi:Dyp-type peroxidase family
MEILEKHDIQGFVLRGYGRLGHTNYVLLHIDDAKLVKKWLAQMSIEVTDGNQHPRQTALNVAISCPGLEALGMSEENRRQFSREFREGLTEPHRQRLLGDVGEDAPDQWRWGGTQGDANAERIHIVLMVFAADAPTLAAYWEQVKPVVLAHGMSILGMLDGHLREDNKEEFGFRDGISQPQIAGNHPNTSPTDTVAAGEFLLGYKNEYGVFPETPLIAVNPQQGDVHLLPTILVDDQPKKDLGRNGSYLVFRQMQQHVDEFWEFMRKNSTSEDDAIKLASKMMGRWPSGAPLTLDPEVDPGKGKDKYFARNDFGFAKDDKEGMRCPFGSHIRRSNPRDVFEENDADLSLSLTKKHRIIRRGRSYEFRIAEAEDQPSKKEVGLNFMCFNADISHQFEFLYHTWINFPRFDRLYNDPDPIIGTERAPGPGVEQNFTIPQCPVNRQIPNLERFVTIRGGVYLFFPSIKAIKYLATI